ncbi:hypothetical protein [Aquipseudomonas alcaligenes]|uniref:hypothetical protein n=1 Tax=Aquipseudomonas alcaligenes TaxID=43263 RepID=UPI001F3AA846|nr:hypothetical protein [Pseudomonas alcaligenes]
MSIPLTKIDAARRQLATAINLLFNGGDPVSIYSLATNAWEIIDTLCERKNIDSASAQTREHLPEGKLLKRDYINSPYRNFFKHADRDPEAVLIDFSETSADSVLFLAVEDYIRLLKKSPVEFQVFQLWYLAIHIEKIDPDTSKEISESINLAFPSIRELPRRGRLAAGREILNEARHDQELLKDSRTEPVI